MEVNQEGKVTLQKRERRKIFFLLLAQAYLESGNGDTWMCLYSFIKKVLSFIRLGCDWC